MFVCDARHERSFGCRHSYVMPSTDHAIPAKHDTGHQVGRFQLLSVQGFTAGMTCFGSQDAIEFECRE